MSKRLFQVLDEMNVNDDVNKTATRGCCFDMISADKVKAGGHVKMGVPAEAITKIFLGEYQPMLVLLDKKEYHRLKDHLVVDKLQEAEQKADRYEKALKEIAMQNTCAEQEADEDTPIGSDGTRLGDINYAYDTIIEVAREALTLKQTTDDTTK